MKYIIISLFCVIMCSLSFCQSIQKTCKKDSEDRIFKLLTGDSCQYWDPYYLFKSDKFGKGWVFYKDSIFKEYKYVNDERKEIFYGNIVWDDFRFEICGDTIVIKDYNDYRFKILRLTRDSLIIKDISQIRYTYLDSVLLLRSKDQFTKPQD